MLIKSDKLKSIFIFKCIVEKAYLSVTQSRDSSEDQELSDTWADPAISEAA